MELEELNKTQIVLLTLLVSFVTSIATGIVTVTLLDQAPPAVTQTINRIVERTVERVVPAEPGSQSVITTEKETTIVVKEDDLITESIERNKQYLIRIVLASDVVSEVVEPAEGKEGDPVLIQSVNENSVIGLGVIVSADGLVVTDRKIVNTLGRFKGVDEDGSIFDLTVVNIDAQFPTALLQLEVDEGRTFAGAQFIGGDSLKLGQTVISLGGEERTNVSIGIVSDFAYVDIEIPNTEDPEGEVKVMSVLDRIDTSIVSKAISGSPLINIFGEVIGINTSESQKTLGSYTPVLVVQTQLSEIADSGGLNQEEGDPNVASVNES